MASHSSESSASSSSSADETSPTDRQHAVPSPDIHIPQDDVVQTVSSDSAVDSLSSEEDSSSEPGNMTNRAYQLEMLQESLKQNIIVAMDTGSGKTRVAVLRIKAELDRSPPHKICWFLATTVDLCRQQFEVLSTQIPSVNAKVFVGEDGVDSWSTPDIWNKALHNVRVVVSSYQILLDALSHAFVKMDRLALIVFDEAHNCAKKHAGRRIMNEFYQPAKEAASSVPSILGLTASPIMGSKLDAMDELEVTLDAICKGPTRHREELLSQVKRPEMFTCIYHAKDIRREDLTPAMTRLERALAKLNIAEDPYVKSLEAQNTEQSKRKLAKALEKNDTYVQKQMRMFVHRSWEILQEVGPWAADYYIAEVVRRFTDTAGKPSAFRGNWEDNEKRYLMGVLRDIMPLQNGTRAPTPTPTQITLSDKAQKLIGILTAYEGTPFGIIFVKERATAAVLAHVLFHHPELQERYRVASVVGASRFAGKRQDFLDLSKSQDSQSLRHFRKGKVNLLVATSVIEEGIDIPTCNIIVCMDEPTNLKSFIQRRGRARDHKSQIHLLLESSASNAITRWEDLEGEMKRRYEDEMRALEALQAMEDAEPLSDAPFPPLVVPATNARLTIDDATSHLEHFCATLSSRRYVDYRPDYIIHKDSEGLLSATVQLPVSLPVELRSFDSTTSWKAEKNACKDAAFQAYKALYYSGLVNDNLLPERQSVDREVEGRPGMKDVREQINPWRRIAQAWHDLDDLDPAAIHRRPLVLKDENGRVLCEMDLLLPVQVPLPDTLEFYWKHNSTVPWSIDMDSDVAMSQGPSLLSDGRAHTSTLLALPYGHRWPLADRHQLLRFASNTRDLDGNLIGSQPIFPVTDEVGSSHCLVRDSAGNPWVYESWSLTKPPLEILKSQHGGKPYLGYDEAPENTPHVFVSKWPKKAGSVRPVVQPLDQTSQQSGKPYVIPVAGAKLDGIPIPYAQLGMLIPFLTHTLEIHFLASELLASTQFRSLAISDQSLVVTALSAPNAGRYTDYERIEFLGDSILKFCTTINVSAQNLKFPEGLLSLLKDRLVSNSRLSRAAIALGLDAFIATQRFSLKDWRTLYNTDLLAATSSTEQTRNMSTKTLADVVEALIGASFLDGGMPSALRCISLFLPEVQWMDISSAQAALFATAADDTPLPAPLEPLERLIGYELKSKSLLVEAMTHGSYNVPSATACLERLEFIGDAVLDFVVVSRLFSANTPEWKNSDMHLFRTALVNGDFLAYISLEWAIDIPLYEVEADPAASFKHHRTAQPKTNSTTVSLPLWRFMRHANPNLATEQKATSARFAALREEISTIIATGSTYPWTQLARLRAAKCYSDAFEALIGAVWVDSGGSEEAVAEVLERCGIMPYLRRMVRGQVHVLHPKEELGRLAGQKKVRYDVRVVEPVAENEDEEPGEREFVCKVKIGDEEVVEVGGGVTREESKTRAAEEVIRMWKLRDAVEK